ncbi:MAG: protein kinase, partial [Chloroflexi bacterium]|nr:protein kinase [Chloroflexota bacterium]
MADSYVGRFRLIREIGRGGMAVVYLAEDPRLGRNVAIKLIAGQGLADPYFRLAFEREARAIGSLNHPHILPVYDIGEHEGRLYLVMLYVEGGRTLKDALRDGPLPPAEVARLLRHVAHALGHAHAAGLVHRDVKPHNVLVDPSGHAYLADFGLAKAVSAATAALTQTGERGSSGTPIYMSPEQIGSSATIDYRADIYSLGVMAFELLTGTPPYRGEIPAILYQHCFAPIPAATERNPTLPSELDAVLRRALAKSPAERFATAWELAEAVGRAVGGEVTGTSAPTIPPGAVAGIGGARLGQLPVPPTALVGREDTVASVVALFRRPDIRLVTLTGPGGIGKTRLSLEVARELESDFPDGACFVPLASLRDPALVAPTIAQSLGLREATGKPVLETLLDTLRSRRLLLVLDNFEQISEAAPLVAELLAAAPRLAVLVSSRIVLHLRGENEMSVPLLALPDSRTRIDERRRTTNEEESADEGGGETGRHDAGVTGQLGGPVAGDGSAEVARLLGFGAVRLFVERARAVRPEFALSAENATTVAEICRRLEGHPLAIELAAARVKVLSPQALLDRLERRLPLLAGGHRDLPERHQAIRDTIAWSYELLREPERVLFRRLGIFAGGFTLEAVEQLGAHLPSAGLDSLSALETLVDHSLLRQVETHGEPRFAMLELIREYALERLEASSELATVEQAHLFLYLELAEYVEPRLRGPEQERWLEQLEREHDNLRSALRHAFDARDEEAALRLAGALWWFWHLRGHLGEGRRRLEEVSARASYAPARFRAKALRGAGVLANAQGDYDRAIDLFEEALSLYRQAGDRSGVAASVNSLAEVARTRGEYEQAAALYDEALGAARDLDDRRQRAV